MDLNLDTLKREILDYLAGAEFAVFRSHPGGLEGFQMVCWDCERYPDYREFLEAARKTGAKMVLCASREFELSEVDEIVEQLEDCDLTREERRDFEGRLRDFRRHEGATCSLELAFDHHARMYVYELHPDWYDEFIELTDDISSHLPLGDEPEGEDNGIGGFYSNN